MFRVEWLREAVGELAELWIEADSPFRQTITRSHPRVGSGTASRPVSTERIQGGRGADFVL